MQQIKFKKLRENAKLPTKGTEYAGAYDVYASEIIQESSNYYRVKLGFATEIPNGYRVTISPRSGFTKENWYVPNSPCIVDSDYRGEWEVRFRAIPIKALDIIGVLVYDKFPYQVGDRIAQIKLEEILEMEFEEVDNLEDTERAGGAWGSTGK